MKRINSLIILGLSVCGWASAQALTAVTISTNPTGPIFVVDGTSYITPQVFEWPIGSKHIVQFPLSLDSNGNALPYQSGASDSIRYSFGSWSDNNTLLAPTSSLSVTITADPALTSLTAVVTVQYRVHIAYSNATSVPVPSCTGAPDSPPVSGLVYGIVYFNGTCVADTTDLFLPAGQIKLNAIPYPGWVFYGWDINGFQTNASLTTYNLTVPANITPLFSIAKRVEFVTNPPGLNVLVDRTPIQTPPPGPPSTNGCTPDYTRLPPGAPTGFPVLCVGQFDFLPGSQHQIGAPTPQQDSTGTYWVFNAFSNGQGQNTVYTAGTNTAVPDVVTANFVQGVPTSLTTNPSGLHLTIDGNSTFPPPYNYVWGVGQQHIVTAPAQQTDTQGRVWTFSSWSNGQPATQTVAVPLATGFSLAATYTKLEQVQVTSTPAGLTFTIDGNSCVTPCTLNKAAGSQSQITIPASPAPTPTSRSVFVSWSDGSTATTRQVTFSQDTLTLTANYQSAYLLTATSDPANSAAFQVTPTSPDGFYASGTQISVSVTPNNGFKFVKWAGDLQGSFSTGSLTMSSPRTVVAEMLSVPYVAPTGVETAAGPSPDGTVATGSLIAIYGQGLAPSLQIGPSNPLAQTLNNVTVTVNNQLLPLLFVSPGQINAQVPWEIPSGIYTLLIHSVGQPDVSGQMTVSRDAPAIFTQANSQNLPLVLALHQDGTLITFDHPALPGEQISIYGTGFGPYTSSLPDGFPATPTNSAAVADPVTITLGSVPLQPDSASAAPGLVGMTIVKVTLTSALPTSTTVNLTATVNGKISSPVSLPLQ